MGKKETNASWYARNKVALNAAAAERKRANKLAAIRLKGGRCQDCDMDFDGWPSLAEFDHVQGKVFTISDRGAQSFGTLIAELEKCELVCANCHRKRTAIRRLG